MRIKNIIEAFEGMLVLILILSISLYALGLKNGVYDKNEKITEERNLALLHNGNGITINVDIDRKDNKNICFYFDNSTNRDFCCFASVECGNECILQSSRMIIPAFCEDYGVELFGAWRENYTYVNGVVLHIQLYDKHSFEEVYSGTNEFVKGESYTERMTIKELRTCFLYRDRVSICDTNTYDYINFRWIKYVPKIFDDLCVEGIGIVNREFPELIEGRKTFPCMEIQIFADIQQMIQTLNDLEYQCKLENDRKIIYKRDIGYSEVTLELDIQTQEVKKYVTDDRKKVEVAPDDIEIDLMKKLIKVTQRSIENGK